MADRRIFITGVCGCLGSNLVEHLIPQGYQILGVDNYATGDVKFKSTHSDFEIIEGSVNDQPLMESLFEKFRPEVVIHSAASYKDPGDWQEDVKTNISGAICIANAASKYSVEKIINFQTALCYGRPSTVPIPVDAETRPFTSYGISKTAGENYLLNADLNVTSLRLANICGPRLSIGPIPTFYKRLKEGLDCFCSDSTRDFLDIEDFHDLIDLLLNQRGNNTNEVFNVSTGEATSIEQIYQLVASHLGIVDSVAPILPVEKDDVKDVVLDPSKTETALGWKARFNFHETITRQLKWYDEYGIENIYSHLSEKS